MPEIEAEFEAVLQESRAAIAAGRFIYMHDEGASPEETRHDLRIGVDHLVRRMLKGDVTRVRFLLTYDVREESDAG